MNRLSRRQFIELVGAVFAIGVAGIAYDAVVNEGHPALGEDDEPP